MRGSWISDGPEQVSAGVIRLPLPLPNDGLRAVNVYAIEGSGGLDLIDGGWAIPEARETLESGLGKFGYSIADIARFHVTHVHRDHYTLAVALRRELMTASIGVGRGEQATLRMLQDDSVAEFHEPQMEILELSGASHLVPGWKEATNEPRHPAIDWQDPDMWLDDDPLIDMGGRSIRALATPGHTVGHHVFVDEAAGLLFGGDHVLSQITPSIGFEPVPSELPLAQYLRSLAKVRKLPDMTLLPAHGPVASSAHARIDELTEHHGKRLTECTRAVESGRTTGYEVARALLWTRHEYRIEELDPFNSVLAVCETFAHLELLAAQGRVSSELSGARRVFLPA